MRWDEVATPRYVVGSPDHARRVIRHMSSAGWRVREGFIPPAGQPANRLVCYGVVSDPSTAALAVQAAARGAGVIVVLDHTATWSQALVENLAKFGPVRRWDERPAVFDLLARLQPDQRALLERLSTGETIAAAAAAEFMSLRTANRRVAAVRHLLGVATTREAVAVYLRLRGSG